MITCPACKQLISHSSLSFKTSAGFLNPDGSFQEDVKVIIHSECAHNYLYNPFTKLEEKLKDGEL
jgi:hypothetical protein